MKLSNLFPQIKADKVQVKKTRETSPTETANQGGTSGTDRVELSSNPVDVQKMHEIIQQTPEVRAERIQALKEQIAKGDYSVDPYKVADKLLISLMQDNIIE
jgi:negative regulator of flagellin synthesis FlgM